MEDIMNLPTQRAHGIDPEIFNFSKAYETLTLFCSGPPVHPFASTDGDHNAKFALNFDLGPLFPYINAVISNAQMFEKPIFIKFMLEDRLCALYSQEGLFTPVRNLSDAMDFLPRLIHFLQDINTRCNSIAPNYRKYAPVSPLDIYQLLPGTNCRACGHATCMAFAATLARQRATPDQCPYMTPPVDEKAIYPLFDRQGNCIKTLSLDINFSDLRKRIRQTENQIETLQSQLKQYRSIQNERINQANRTLPAPLTHREVEVLQQLAAGSTNKEIARELDISEHTVKSHVIHIFNKIGVNDRTQASVWAASQGLL
jgi:DNA-binding CsgD family transcriptional regulator/ArsR family metal-binding transcriptional regulator